MTHTTLTGQYDFRLIVLSVAIAFFASYVALDFAARATNSRGRSRILWLVGGAFVMGQGIWAMHYIGMLAFRLPLTVSYNVPVVVLSLLAASAASAIALFLVSRKELSQVSLLGGSFAVGAGIAGMHYIGILAMRLAARPAYNSGLVALSVATAILISNVALRLAFSRTKSHPWSHPAAAFLEDMPGQLLALAKFVEAGSALDVENQAHRIKGASASVGLDAMAAVALDMEMAGRTGALAGVAERMAELSAQFACLQEAIARQTQPEA
jgi:NO-binding membrane sensor protein with MHYT domain